MMDSMTGVQVIGGILAIVSAAWIPGMFLYFVVQDMRAARRRR